MKNFQINPERRIKIHHVGQEQNDVIQIDDLWQQPDELLAFAQGEPDFQPVSGDLYPGVRKFLPESYGASLLDAITDPIREIFHLATDSQLKTSFCALSLTTIDPRALLPIQRIPHFDTCNSHQLAAVLYLCDPYLGGTSFYRHRSTGFESVPETCSMTYARTLEQEADTVGLPGPYYIDGDTELFERIAGIDAQYNRMVIYRSNLLHSGNIQPQYGLSARPEEGRLTANCFITY